VSGKKQVKKHNARFVLLIKKYPQSKISAKLATLFKFRYIKKGCFQIFSLNRVFQNLFISKARFDFWPLKKTARSDFS
jgi:hypothetical protein